MPDAVAAGPANNLPRSQTTAEWHRPDARRRLQLVFAGIWLFDAVLQFQSYMFTRAFGSQMLAPTAQRNPWVIGRPIAWAGVQIAHHAVAANALFAITQVLIAFGIACRRTVKVGLLGSVVWSIAVWWLGEGLGGVLTGSASPVNGAPGAVILYGLLAVLLWPPADQSESRLPFVAGGLLGVRRARLVWFALWGSLSFLALQPAERAPESLQHMISAMGAGEPGWLASLDRGVSQLLVGRGLGASVALAALLAFVALGIFLPPTASRAVLALAVVVATCIWVLGENFGALFTGSATDPNSGPLLALLAAAYWPLRSPARSPVPERISATSDRTVPGTTLAVLSVTEG